MNTFALEIWDDECPACTFYTVRWEDDSNNETDKFFTKYNSLEAYREASQILMHLIVNSIGNNHGAHDAFFNRDENEVKGLPPKGKIKLSQINYHYEKFPLRLYALKLSKNIVILFNGGIKDNTKNQNSSLSFQWQEACSFARKIDRAIKDRDITVDESNGRILFDDDSSNIIL